MVNQVETHVFNQQIEAQKIMEQYGTRIMAWGPFAEGRNNFFDNETLIAVGTKYNKRRGTDRSALPYPTRRDCHSEICPQGTYGAKYQCIRLHVE